VSHRLPRRALKKRYQQFQRAAIKGDARIVVRLIRQLPELQNYEGGGGSLLDVLRIAAPQLLAAAFEAGLSPDVGERHPAITFLQQAAADGNLERLRLAIQYGADLERPNDWGETALGYACAWGQFEAVRLLVEAGADVNGIEDDPRPGYRYTPLDCAYQYPEIAEYLRSHGAKRLEEIEPEVDQPPES
jgi:ankyrin repeat protein